MKPTKAQIDRYIKNVIVKNRTPEEVEVIKNNLREIVMDLPIYSLAQDYIYLYDANVTQVDGLFTWSRTPQGLEYWSRLNADITLKPLKRKKGTKNGRRKK